MDIPPPMSKLTRRRGGESASPPRKERQGLPSARPKELRGACMVPRDRISPFPVRVPSSWGGVTQITSHSSRLPSPVSGGKEGGRPILTSRQPLLLTEAGSIPSVRQKGPAHEDPTGRLSLNAEERPVSPHPHALESRTSSQSFQSARWRGGGAHPSPQIFSVHGCFPGPMGRMQEKDDELSGLDREGLGSGGELLTLSYRLHCVTCANTRVGCLMLGDHVFQALQCFCYLIHLFPPLLLPGTTILHVTLLPTPPPPTLGPPPK